jgi:hypothetical protein
MIARIIGSRIQGQQRKLYLVLEKRGAHFLEIISTFRQSHYAALEIGLYNFQFFSLDSKKKNNNTEKRI